MILQAALQVDIDDSDFQLILESFGFAIEKKLYSAGDLRKFFGKLKKIS